MVNKQIKYVPPTKIIIVTAPTKLLQAGAKVMREAIKKARLHGGS
jgi:hypothetical protein